MVADQDLIEKLSGYLKCRSTMTLSTVGDVGVPHSAPLFFVSDDNLNLYFLSDVESQHGTNIINHVKVAVSIYGETHEWQQIRGIQLEGNARLMNDPSAEKHAWSLYRSKFSFVLTLGNLVEASRWFRVYPNWIRWIDNRVSFGNKQEFFLEDHPPYDMENY